MQSGSQGVDIVIAEELDDVLLNQIVHVPEEISRRHEDGKNPDASTYVTAASSVWYSSMIS